MKKVLITGANSYIGTSFEQWGRENCTQIICDTLNMHGEDWKDHDFSGYDTVFHVAGIAHADVQKVTKEEQKHYYDINTDLAVACAKKAKEDGVDQFIYMSSMIVYGESGGIGKARRIHADTVPTPANFYGDSKLQAEIGLRKLETADFKIVILRPPMIYGKGSRGNYPVLSKMAEKLPLFPKERNERSMLYIGNLCKFVSLMILNEERGTFYPQNSEYVCTSDLVREIARVSDKKICMTTIFHPILLLMGRLGGKTGRMVNKAFGNMAYDRDMSIYKEEYCLYDFETSVRLTEEKAGKI